MKRKGGLYAHITTRDALMAAYHAAAKHKTAKRACFNFERCLASNIDALYQDLKNGSYCPKPYYTFEVYEPKQRTIYAPAFRDLVVQHAVHALVNPIFDCTFIDQSYACRKGMGTHKAADYAQDAMRRSSRESYTLKIDIRKFFYRIERDILRKLIERKIKDARVVDLMMKFANHGQPLGIPIGNLLSQLYALIYLSPMDHYIKRVLKIKYYCRYVDDGLLIGLTHKECVDAHLKIERFIHNELHLEYSHTTIAHIKKGVNFVGFRTWHSKRFIRKRSLYVFRQSLKKGNIESVVSLLGHARHTSSIRHMLDQIDKEVSNENHCIQKIYRQLNHAYI